MIKLTVDPLFRLLKDLFDGLLKKKIIQII